MYSKYYIAKAAEEFQPFSGLCIREILDFRLITGEFIAQELILLLLLSPSLRVAVNIQRGLVLALGV